MTYDHAGLADFRQRLLTSPGERQDVDYKASARFQGDDSFSLKLVRHILGMANSGGGWLVIGYREMAGQALVPDPNHKNEVCDTYDPTELSQRVNSYVARGQQVRVGVFLETHPHTRLRYPIIQVEGFQRLPYFCRSDKGTSASDERILRQGAIYIRRPGAETSEASTPADWEELISRCVRLRRDEFLMEFRELFERMTSPKPPEISASERLHQWTQEMHNRMLGSDS